MTTIDETVRQHKFILDECEIPTAWYNLVADLPSPPPPASTRARWSRPAPTTSRRSSRWASSCRRSATSAASTSPEGCSTSTGCGGPTPAVSAPTGLEKALGTPAHIYYKYEGVSPAG